MDKTRIYSQTGNEVQSSDYSVRINGNPVFVYQARVSAVPFNQVWPGYQRPLDQTEIASFAHWDMSDAVTIEVVSNRPVDSVAIRPASYNIQPGIENNKITFKMSKPGYVTLEVNGTHHALHLFASELEENAPNPGDTDVKYFGPGVHNAGRIDLKSGETVYIAGGAVVHGIINARKASNINILGRGILDASTYEREGNPGPISFYRCENIRIDGIIIRDPNVWTVTATNCKHLAISNIKLIGLWRYNADGIDIVNSQDVTIDKCFVRSYDDSIVIKGLKGVRQPIGDQPVKDVRVSDCVIWNDWGRALEIGAETVAPEMSGIIFKNCDIIRTVHIAMDIQHGDRALIHDIRFENIRFEIDDNTPLPKFQSSKDEKYIITGKEGYCPRLIVLEIRENNYSNDKERGRIQNIVFKDIFVTGKRFPESYLVGYDSEHRVEDITIENLRVNGKMINNTAEGHFSIGDYVENVKFIGQ